MSTLKATNLQHKDSSDPNVVLYSDGSTSIRNLQNFEPSVVMNGEMRVAQRGTASVLDTSSAPARYVPCCDRWKVERTSTSAGDVRYSQENDAPPGFIKSLRATNNAVTSFPTTGTAYQHITQTIENTQAGSLCWGTSAAKAATLTFWVKSSIAGDNVVEVVLRRRTEGGTQTLSIALQVDIEAANTWEFKTLSVPATTEAPRSDQTDESDAAFNLFFSFYGLVSGNRLPSYGTWTDGNFLGGPAGNENVFHNVNGATFSLAGVQMTATDSFTGFQYEDYATTLSKCQRYYNTGNFWMQAGPTGSTRIGSRVYFPTTMRGNPFTSYTQTLGVNGNVFYQEPDSIGIAAEPNAQGDIRGVYTASAEF